MTGREPLFLPRLITYAVIAFMLCITIGFQP
jgi:hypothetical protein